MARTTTTAQYIQVSSSYAPTTAGTQLIVLRRTANSGANTKVLFGAMDGAAATVWRLAANTTDKLVWNRSGTTITTATMTAVAADNWICLAMTKVAGTTGVRFHKYVYDTGVATHETPAGTAADGTGTAGSIIVSRSVPGDATSVTGTSDVAAIAIYPTVLADSEIESAACSLWAMMSYNPTGGLWLFDGDPGSVNELFLSSSTSTADTSTVVSAGNPFSLGQPVRAEDPPTASAQTLSPTALATAEAFGTAVIGGAVALSPTAVATAEAFGTTAVTTTITLSPTALATAESFGTAVLAVGPVTLSPSSVASLEAFGTAVLGGNDTVSPTSIATLEAFGSVVISGLVTLAPTSMPTAGILGAPSVSTPVAMGPVAISSGEDFGSPTVGTVVRRFTTPTIRKQFAKDGLFRWYGYDEGQALLLLDSEWVLIARPTAVQLASATVRYMGGREYVITEAEAQVLVDEGYDVITEVSETPEASAYGSAVLDDDPEIFWRLGDTTDSSGNDRDSLIAVNPTSGLLSGDTDGATLSAGVDSEVVAYFSPEDGLDFVISSGISVEAWLKGTLFATVFTSSVANGAASIYAGYPLADDVTAIFRTEEDPVTNVVITANATGWNDNLPHHFAATADGTDLRLYLDGVEVATGALVGSFAVNLFAAQQFTAGVTTFDEVAFYSTALGADRVLAHFNAGS